MSDRSFFAARANSDYKKPCRKSSLPNTPGEKIIRTILQGALGALLLVVLPPSLLAADTNTITGQVTDSHGNGLRDMDVFFINVEESLWTEPADSEAFTVSGSGGVFSAYVPDGRFDIITKGDLYGPFVYDYRRSPYMRCRMYRYATIMKDSQWNLRIPTADLSGIVLNTRGTPIPGVRIENEKSSGFSNYVYDWVVDRGGYTYSDINGRFTLTLIKSAYGIRAIPGEGSGYAQTYMERVKMDSDRVEIIILHDLAGAPQTVQKPVTINLDAERTSSRTVTITFSFDNCTQMKLSNDNIDWTEPEQYSGAREWTLSAGDGPKTVFARFGDGYAWTYESETDSIVLDTTSKTPSGLTASAGNTTAILDWTDVYEEDFQGYNVYRSTSSDDGFTKLNSNPVPYSQYQDSDLVFGTVYYYSVASVDMLGNESLRSNAVNLTPIDTIAPRAPTGLVATAGDAAAVLNWDDSRDSDFNAYNIYRSASREGSYTKLNPLLWRYSYYRDTRLANGTTYYYAVTAVDVNGNESARSASASVVPKAYPPTAFISASPVSGAAPLTVLISGYGTDAGTITKCDVDFDGDGKYDLSSRGEIKIAHAYNEQGEYSATLRVTDNDGLTATDSVIITVERYEEAPTAALTVAPASVTAPLTVTFGFRGSDSDGTIEEHRIDFDGDGTWDFSSVAPGSVSYTYGEAGTYTARLMVMDDTGTTDTDSRPIYVDNTSRELVADARCSVSEGEAPLTVQFSGSAVGGSGKYARYIWDFDGDGIWDLTSITTADAAYTYTEPGSYSAMLKVVDSDGLSDTDSCPISAYASASLKVWISVPNDGTAVWGNRVTVRANTAPGDLTQCVKLQYKSTEDTEWNDISRWLYPGERSFTASWDVTLLKDGAYYGVRGYALDIDGTEVTSPMILVRVQSPEPEISEGLSQNGIPEKTEKISKNRKQDVVTSDSTAVSLPMGSVSQDTTITVSAMPANPHSEIADSEELTSFRRIELDDATIEKPIQLTIPYEDADSDGYVDGTGAAETDLVVYWFDEEEYIWKMIGDCSVDTDLNTVTATVIHFTDFALAPRNCEFIIVPHINGTSQPGESSVGTTTQAPVPGGGGGGGGCFLSI